MAFFLAPLQPVAHFGVMRATAFTAAVMLLAGCDAGPPTRDFSVTVTDSAGIEIVHTQVGDTGAEALAVHEELRIGTVDGPPESQLFFVGRPVAATDGTVFVPLLRSGEIRVFDAEGAYLRTIGRAGDGPGEFAGLNLLYLVGDILYAVDARLRRVTAFTEEGELLSTASLPAVGDRLVSVSFHGRLGDDWMLSLSHPYDWPEHGRFVDRRTSLFLSPSGSGLDGAFRAFEREADRPPALAEYTWSRMFGMRQGGALTGQSPLWGPRGAWASDGARHIFVTVGDEYRIDAFEPEGTLVRSLRRSHEPVPITPEFKDRFLAEAAAHHDTAGTSTEFGVDPMVIERFRADLPTPPHLPPLGSILAGPDGTLLVERPDLVADPVAQVWTRLGPQPSTWDLFDPDGAFVGAVTFPLRFAPHLLLEDAVLGVHRDELGVEYVVRLRIETP